MDSNFETELIEAALHVRRRAYAPYSSFLVGAAIRTNSGAIATGCNFENASFGLAICAERCAVGNMIASGEQQIDAIAIASRGGASPCGACRQVLVEFGADFPVILVDSESRLVTSRWNISQLLPAAFMLSHRKSEAGI